MLNRWWEVERNPAALNELAWARCTSSNAEIFSAELAPILGAELAAIEATHREPAWLDTVVACHAAAGKIDEAITAQKAALKLAEKRLGSSHLMVDGMRARLAKFKARERIVETVDLEDDG